MGDLFLSEDAMNSGQLVRPFEQSVHLPLAYYMAIPLAMVENPIVEAFRNWIRLERAQSFPHPEVRELPMTANYICHSDEKLSFAPSGQRPLRFPESGGAG